MAVAGGTGQASGLRDDEFQMTDPSSVQTLKLTDSKSFGLGGPGEGSPPESVRSSVSSQSETGIAAVRSQHDAGMSMTADGPWSSAFESAGPDVNSTSKWAPSASTKTPLAMSRSAPLLPASHSSHSKTWYSASAARSTSQSTSGSTIRQRSLWQSLGGSWRASQTDAFGNSTRKNVDDAREYIKGSVPNWEKGVRIRKLHVIEHELTWAYYRMRKEKFHPLKKEVGDPFLPDDAVIADMKNSGSENKFQFWRDLRPPFNVVKVTRIMDDVSLFTHADDLFEVTYQCGIEYVGERKFGEKSDGGTFDNKITATARVRIPDSFPKRRPIEIVTWGQPQLCYQPTEELDEDGQRKEETFIDPKKWMSLTDEIGQRPDKQRFAAVRRAVTNAHMKKIDFPRVMEVDNFGNLTYNSLNDGKPEKTMLDGISPKRKRQHRIFTAAAGFVRYAG